ncbi:TPA: cytochrome P450, cyclodipeptide synthase-associated [Bacillus cereus]|uniref:cytochrome P450, cyclodipeptide synthase-associated n=1 Tax=Bacillus cereus group TaxID=86661 RepID=UPI0010409376|nr:MULTISPECIES: cytochrome P450, cyclodipeptide synthase-associated [Bacillus cereus group]HDR7533195.1 cytochrome P450, cyclodipeptide synthase-associated [Bacillus anthracis]KAA0751178.1 cytochrome P450, cyclodipeptide synthase-associated [Bacillus sp. AY1-10]MCU5691677.1 cytochrome P450, cyclodipeptide synthase-associated [Bacillus cereus]MCU5697010.1 cytochrome P450, cyclodipeptide synthase-associated [Bacillus cereus]TBX87863.1 cytochrome P450, cyclodipeptide synthase-associated [Bacillu
MSNTVQVINILSEKFQEDPYKYFSYLRENDPVHHEPEIDSYFISRYQDVRNILNDTDTFTTKSLAERAEPVMRGPVLAQMRGKEHVAKRKIVLRSFMGDALQKLMPLIKKNAEDLLSPYLSKGKIDLINDFGRTFAVYVTMDMIGLDKKDHQKIGEWHSGVADFITSINQPAEARKHSLWCSEQLANYLEPIIKERRLNPQDDLISKLCSAKYEGIAMTDTDILALILNILLAATEPGDKTLALLIYNLINHPKQFQDVLNDRSLVPLAIAETLRYNPPVQLIPRQLSRNTEVGGVHLSEGTTVFCMIGAANRDPNAFEKPDEFNIYRPDLDIKKAFSGAARHLAFGSGIHNCVGAAFAKSEIEIVVNVVLDNMKNIRLEEGFQYAEKGLYTRGPVSMPILFDKLV